MKIWLQCVCFLILLLMGCGTPPPVTPPLRYPFGSTTPCTSWIDESYSQGKYDIYIPQISLPDDAPKPVVIYIHGGGFTELDKQTTKNPYVANADVAKLLESGIVFASINYRLINNTHTGIKNCVADGMACIQKIRSKSAAYGINPDNLALWGNSAGAGIAMLIGFDAPLTPNPVKAMLLEQPQATYDIDKWVSEVFPASCVTRQYICDKLNTSAMPRYLQNIYDITDPSITDCDDIVNAAIPYRADVDILAKIDVADPPVWIENTNVYDAPLGSGMTCNLDRNALNHHSNHCFTLKNKAAALLPANTYRYYYKIKTGVLLWDAGKAPSGAPFYATGIAFLKGELQ